MPERKDILIAALAELTRVEQIAILVVVGVFVPVVGWLVKAFIARGRKENGEKVDESLIRGIGKEDGKKGTASANVPHQIVFF